MKTNKTISTISYNTEEKLKSFLNGLIEIKAISYWVAIKHIGEELDNGTQVTKEKDHWHVMIEPHVQVDTVKLQEMSEEIDPNNVLPLKCIHFRKTNSVDDWYWYELHDVDYLLTKGEERQYHYTEKDFIYSDADEFKVRFDDAMHNSEIIKKLRIKRMLVSHTADELVRMGIVMPEQCGYMAKYEEMFRRGDRLLQERTDRRINGESERLRQLAEEIALD